MPSLSCLPLVLLLSLAHSIRAQDVESGPAKGKTRDPRRKTEVAIPGPDVYFFALSVRG
jgi:hypothetical protein